MKVTLVVLCMAVLPIIVALPATGWEPKARWISASSLNVRSGPSVESEIVGRFPYGTKVMLQRTEGEWAYVSEYADNLEGWVHSDYLTGREIRARRWSRIKIGTPSDLVVAWRGEGIKAPEIIGNDENGLIVIWTYPDESYVIRRWAVKGASRYRVAEIRPR